MDMRMKMVDRIDAEGIETLLREGIDDIKELAVIDLKGGDHWQVDIAAPIFNGLSMIKQHKVIYKILAQPLASEAIHALVINAKGTDS